MKYKNLLLALALMLTLVTLVSCSFVSSLLPQPKSAYDIAVENGFQGSEEDWLASMKGDAGNQGKSAYELYCDLFGYEGSEEQWLIDLRTGALISFKVTFDLNGGQAPEGFVSSATVCGGSFLDLKTPTKDGYTFLGWYTGDGDTDFAMTATTAVRSDLSLTAKWRKDVMSVRFLDKEGNLLKQETVHYGEDATAPEAPRVEGFMFQKWDVDFSAVTEDIIVTALYSPLYTLSFETDGGTAIADATYLAEQVPQAPIDPKKDDLVFRGWYADEDFTTPFDFSAPLTQNTTVYAYFSDLKPISNAEELKAIGDNSTGNFYLTNDINLGGEVWTPLVGFAGEFDGRGYKIHDFVISETQSAGFFTTNSGTIKNLTLADFMFTVSTRGNNNEFVAGALVGTNDGTIQNCHIADAFLFYDNFDDSTSVHRSYAGCLVGVNNGVITDSTVCVDLKVNTVLYHGWDRTTRLYLSVGGMASINKGDIFNAVVDIKANISVDSRQDYSQLIMGGMVADNSGNIVNCQSKVDVMCDAASSREFVNYGGFAQNNSGIILQCSAIGSFEMVKSFQKTYVGGFVESNSGTIKDCYTKTTLQNLDCASTNNSAVGGFVARNKGLIASCYAAGNIKSGNLSDVGGFVGVNQGGSICKSFATGDITYVNPTRVGCFVGTSKEGALSKNYYSTESKIMQGETDVTVSDENATAADLATLQSKAFLIDMLGWNAEVWEIIDGQYPTLVKGE